jgi:membrane protein YqaA with SNARE-associated domain
MEAFSEWGYFGLFLASFIAATVLPLSSEIVFSVLIVNNYDLATCLVIATLGNWIGGMSSYALGWLAKWSFIEKYLRIKKERIQSFKIKIENWGSFIAFFCWLPIIGDPLAVGLGVFKANIIKVSIWMLIGKMIRYLAWAAITYWGFSLI